jgi:hypothetical protein
MSLLHLTMVVSAHSHSNDLEPDLQHDHAFLHVSFIIP